MTGGVLNTINIRLDAKTISYILEHSEAKVLVVDDRQLHIEVKKALGQLKRKITVIDINDKHADQSKLEKIGDFEYEEFLKQVMKILNGKCQMMNGKLIIKLYIRNNW